jgi:molecular chaperone DnaK (HSP70)
MRITLSTASAMLWVAGGLFSCASAKAILGVDLGSLYMKVALVQRGAPLEIVTNLHSKRRTEQMVLFDQGSRFYGADANGLLARKPTKTPVGMSVVLGRDEDHPAVKVGSFCLYRNSDFNPRISQINAFPAINVGSHRASLCIDSHVQ